MPFFDSYARLEPAAPSGDLDQGFTAPIADPAWFLTRQWQLGELQGEDAGSPILVHYQVTLQPLTDPQGRDARTTPTSALVEAHPDQWWTPGRRLRHGARWVARAEAERPDLVEGLRALSARGLPPPYDAFNGVAPDGLRIARTREALGVPAEWLADLPDEARAPLGDTWDPSRFIHTGQVDAGPVRFDIASTGGAIDWYSADGRPGPAPDQSVMERAVTLPIRMNYQGAPAPRWWEIEPRSFDVGGFPPDRSHFATLLLIDVVSSHSDDWFLFLVKAPETPLVGQMVTLSSIEVTDSFGERHTLSPPEGDWSLFDVDGVPSRWSLPVFPLAASPLAGPPIDEVDLAVDEDANLLWAVERRIDGVEVSDERPKDREPLEPGFVADASEAVAQRYDPTSPLRPHWHPYTLQLPPQLERHVDVVGPVHDHVADTT
ncbi:MAG: hypothetical protein AAGA48_35950 [Myxococcota bacterium]